MNAQFFNASQCQCAWLPKQTLNLENAEFSGATSALFFIETLLKPKFSINDLVQHLQSFTYYLSELQNQEPKIAQLFYRGFVSIIREDLEESLEDQVIPFEDFDLIKAEQSA